MVIFFGIFFSLCWIISLVCFLKSDWANNFTAKYFTWSLKFWGFEGEIRPTAKAKTISRAWNAFMLVVFSVLLFLVLSGKLK